MDKVARRHMINLTSKVNEFWANDAYCDVEIHVEESVFKCHRLILAAASEYFNVMFGGKFKESAASEVTLKDVVQPQIFEEILRFFYTGEVSINDTNLCKLFRASDFFELPYMRELCLQYVQQNMDALAQDGLEMFSFARATGKAAFGEIIGQYVCKNLDYFSKTREFLELSFEDFIAILNLIPRSASTANKSQDVYMNAIIRWIRHTDRSPRDMKSQFDELLNRINFVRLSSDCIKDLIKTNINDLIALRENGASNDEIQPHCLHAIDSENLHVYFNASSDEDKSTFVTSVFSLRDQPSGKAFDRWVNSYQFDSTNSYHFMRTIVLDGSLYCLSTSTRARPQSTEVSQIFRKSSSIFLCSNSYLKPPPLTLDHYDMCGRDKHIYVYNRNPLSANIIPNRPSDDRYFIIRS